MLELHQMQDHNKAASSKLERFIKNPGTIGQILLPTLPEISYTLDLVDRHTEYFSDSMFEIRKAQALLESYLSKLNQNDAENKKVAADRSDEEASTISRQDDPLRASKFNKKIKSDSLLSLNDSTVMNKKPNASDKIAPLLKSLQDQNMMRILEAHLYAAVINSNISNPYVKPGTQPADVTTESSSSSEATKPVSADSKPIAISEEPVSTAKNQSKAEQAKDAASSKTHVADTATSSKGPVNTAKDSINPLIIAARSRPPIAQILQQARIAPPPLYINPNDAPHFDTTKAKIDKIRDKMTIEIRRRKLVKQAAWEELGDRYLWLQHRWDKHIDDVEKEEQSEANLPINAKINELSKSATSGRSTINSSTPVIEPNLMQLPDRATRSTFPEAQLSKGLGEVENNELLLQGLFNKDEIMAQKVQQGKCTIPSMISPNMHANNHYRPPAPTWSTKIRPFHEADGKAASEEYTSKIKIIPDSVPAFFDVIDLNSNRMTLDGCRQLCSHLPLHVECPPNCNCAKTLNNHIRYNRVWTDMEKSIFLDKFILYPKNFHKIASFLHNRSTQDCIKFYYDSKAVIPYKALLREHDNRRKNVRFNWSFSLTSASSVGTVLYPPGGLETNLNEPLIELPIDDICHNTFLNHPPYTRHVLGVEQDCGYRVNKLSSVPRKITTISSTHRINKSRETAVATGKAFADMEKNVTMNEYLVRAIRDNVTNASTTHTFSFLPAGEIIPVPLKKSNINLVNVNSNDSRVIQNTATPKEKSKADNSKDRGTTGTGRVNKGGRTPGSGTRKPKVEGEEKKEKKEKAKDPDSDKLRKKLKEIKVKEKKVEKTDKSKDKDKDKKPKDKATVPIKTTTDETVKMDDGDDTKPNVNAQNTDSGDANANGTTTKSENKASSNDDNANAVIEDNNDDADVTNNDDDGDADNDDRNTTAVTDNDINDTSAIDMNVNDQNDDAKMDIDDTNDDVDVDNNNNDRSDSIINDNNHNGNINNDHGIDSNNNTTSSNINDNINNTDGSSSSSSSSMDI